MLTCVHSKLGGGARKAVMESDKTVSEKVPTVQDIVQRIVDMAKVLYGLHMVRMLTGARLGGCVVAGLSPGVAVLVLTVMTDGRACLISVLCEI